MIPKLIHYCWFGGNPLHKEAIKCINSWKKYFPDYEIVEWNENNFDYSQCLYAQEAYKAKKWAFVSDYARFKILYEKGGLYFDTDVEVIRSLEIIISNGAFMGFEDDIKKLVNPGLGLGVEKGNEIYKEILNFYEGLHFDSNAENNKILTVVDYATEILRRNGLSDREGIQQVKGIKIYPKEYFNPMDMSTGKIHCTKQTRTIHHYSASWVDDYSRFRGKVYQLSTRLFGTNGAEKIRKIVGRK